MRLAPFVVFDAEDVSAATPPAPEPPAAAAAPEPELSGPWAKDLQEFFSGKEQIGLADVNRFMAEKYQPYVTRIEQESAPARDLYNDLVNDPQATMAALVAEIYGEDDKPNEALAERFLQLVAGGASEEDAAAQAVAENDGQQQSALAPEDQELLSTLREREQAAAYDRALEDLKAATNTEFTKEEISPFVVTAEGDLQKAHAAMLAYREQVEAALRERIGVTEPPATETPAPPAPLGSSATGDGTPTPPVQKRYDSLDAALDDFLAEDRARRTAPQTL